LSSERRGFAGPLALPLEGERREPLRGGSSLQLDQPVEHLVQTSEHGDLVAALGDGSSVYREERSTLKGRREASRTMASKPHVMVRQTAAEP